ncbi:hypothetical protein DENSPDRAFT_780286 [Dentipellis sp. KUC8613]|nr:hypothetical protein DENSPDRAFT_780286 [Dentipellis sp. KUC8613]
MSYNAAFDWFIFNLFLSEDEQYDIDDDAERRTLAAAIVAGAEEAQLSRNLQRQFSRQYLQRLHLLPDPRGTTPWSALFDSRSDRAFITTMGIDMTTFIFLLEKGFAYRWVTRPIPRPDSDALAARPDRRSLDAEGALGLTLHYLNSTVCEMLLGQVFALIPATVSRYVSFCLDILLESMREINEARIAWPHGALEFQELTELVMARHPRLEGAFATVDGLNLLVQTSEDLDVENATYNGWMSEHMVSSVIVYSPKGLVVAARLNAPGSWHDSRVAQGIYEKLRTRTPPGYYIVADTAFPRGTSQIEGRIRAPLKVGHQLEGTPMEIAERLAFDREILSYRQTAEWGMRALQGSFGRLRVPLNISHIPKRADILELCLRLHNLRTLKVGINQIRTVYMGHWLHTAEDDTVWKTFENMLFREQRQHDRVSRFHTLPSYES